MSQHTITAEVEVRFWFPGMPEDERETAYPTLDITYSYSPGYDAARGGPGGWDPGYGPEVELISATLVDGDGLGPTDAQVRDWARDWLDDQGYDEAVAHAERGLEPDPDAAYDAMRDDKMTGDW